MFYQVTYTFNRDSASLFSVFLDFFCDYFRFHLDNSVFSVIIHARTFCQIKKLNDGENSDGGDGIVSFANDYPLQNCHLDQLMNDDPRIVFVSSAMNQNRSAADMDVSGGMKTVVGHLLARGYRKPALLPLSAFAGNRFYRTAANAGRKGYFRLRWTLSVQDQRSKDYKTNQTGQIQSADRSERDLCRPE